MPEHPEFSAIPARLHGLDLGRLFGMGTIRAAVPLPSLAAWIPPEPSAMVGMVPGFEIRALIGRGGMGAVYLARQMELNRDVAIKILPPAAGHDFAFAERFRHEARTLAQLRHPGIVTVYESGEAEDGHLYFVMELVDGQDLARRLQGKALDPGEVSQIVRHVCDALGYAHQQGIVHRDIKPSNILVASDGGVKVVDFGLAVIMDRAQESRLTATGTALGTADYAAPEQLQAHGTVDARADLYSLGVLTYELLTGRPPRGVFDPPSVLCPQVVDPAWDAVVLTALQSDPARRFQSAGAYAQALVRAADARANQIAREKEIRRKLLARARLAGAFGALAALALAAAIFGWWQSEKARANETRARKNREAAEELITLLADDIGEELLLAQRPAVLTTMLDRADAYYRRLPPEDLTPAGRLRQANFRIQRMMILRLDSRLPEALTVGEEAQALLRTLIETGSSDPRLFADLGHARLTESAIHMLQRKTDLALSERLSARLDLGKAWSRFPESMRLAFLYTRSCRLLGETYRAVKRPEDAINVLLEAGLYCERLNAVEGERRRFTMEHAATWEEMGGIEEERKNYPAALIAFRQSVALTRASVQGSIWNFDDAYPLCTRLAREANVHLWLEDYAAAEHLLRESVHLAEEIGVRAPSASSFWYQCRYVFHLYAEVLEHRGNKQEAEKYRKRSQEAGAKIAEMEQQR